MRMRCRYGQTAQALVQVQAHHQAVQVLARAPAQALVPTHPRVNPTVITKNTNHTDQ